MKSILSRLVGTGAAVTLALALMPGASLAASPQPAPAAGPVQPNVVVPCTMSVLPSSGAKIVAGKTYTFKIGVSCMGNPAHLLPADFKVRFLDGKGTCKIGKVIFDNKLGYLTLMACTSKSVGYHTVDAEYLDAIAMTGLPASASAGLTVTAAPTPRPTVRPTAAPTPTPAPTLAPTLAPTATPTVAPSAAPTAAPTAAPGGSTSSGGGDGSLPLVPLVLVGVLGVCALGGLAFFLRRRRAA